MPLFGTFSSASSRALGLRNGSPPLSAGISAPTENQSLAGSGNTTNRINTTVSFTSTVTSFAIDRFEFKVDQLDGSDNIVVAGTYQTAASAGANDFLLSNLLTSTKYGLYMRTVDVAGLVSEPTSRRRFTTAAEVAPTVPARTLSSTDLSVTIAYAAGTAGTYAIGTREYSLCPTTGGTTTYVPFTETVTRTTRTDGGAALVPGTEYTVSFRYTASVTLTASTASSTVSTLAEVVNSTPTVSINSVTTTNVTFTRTDSSGGTYGVSYYQYVIHDSAATSVRTGTMTTGETQLSLNLGTGPTSPTISPDATFVVYVRAISLTSTTPGSYGSVSGQLNPGTPAAPTNLDFSGMTISSTGSAYLTFSKPAYATLGFVVVASSTDGAQGTGTYSTTLSGSTFSCAIGNQSYNATYTYKAYVRTRTFLVGGTTPDFTDSGLSNTKTWVTPKKNVPRTWTAASFGLTTNYTDYTYVIPTNSCEPYRLAVRFPSSGIAATEDEVGYMRVDYMTATFRCNVQLKRPSEHGSNVNFQQPDYTDPSTGYTYPVTTALTSLCNTTNLRFSTATHVNSTTISSVSNAKPNTGWPSFSEPNLGSSDQGWYRSVVVGGTSLHNKVFFASSSSGKSWNSGCSLSLKGDYFSGKNMSVVGVETTPGSLS